MVVTVGGRRVERGVKQRRRQIVVVVVLVVAPVVVVRRPATDDQLGVDVRNHVVMRRDDLLLDLELSVRSDRAGLHAVMVRIDIDQALIKRIVLGVLRHVGVAAVVADHDVIVRIFPHHVRAARVVRRVIDRVQLQRIIAGAGIKIDVEQELAAGCQELLDGLVRAGADAGVEAVIEVRGGAIGVGARNVVRGVCHLSAGRHVVDQRAVVIDRVRLDCIALPIMHVGCKLDRAERLDFPA
jgi:hypothetical protein